MVTSIRWAACGALLLGLNFPLHATAAAAAAHQLDVVNEVPRFQKFYADATRLPLSEAARWGLWKKEYGIAAVPPGPKHDEMARKLLDSAWPRYPALLTKLPNLSKEAEAEARALFEKDNALLGTQKDPIHVRVVLYVGQFDHNAFTIPPMNGSPTTVFMPVDDYHLEVALAHELTHAINIQIAHVKNGFGAPVGETVFMEGLAMRTSQEAVAGLSDKDYAADPSQKGWMQKCYVRQGAVLAGIKSDLDKQGNAIAMKYVYGDGNAGMHREVYCAAWIVTGHMLKSGWTLAELAHIPESKMVSTVSTVIASIDNNQQSGHAR